MIDVKGTRTATPEADPSDPLGLRPKSEAGTKLLSSMMVGLLSVGLYLRSFLWQEHVAYATEEESLDGEVLPNALPRSRRNDMSNTPDQAGIEEERGAPHSQDMAVAFYRLPVITGPFGASLFAPAPFTQIAGAGLPAVANADLPPFLVAPEPIPMVSGPLVPVKMGAPTVVVESDQLIYPPLSAPGLGDEPPQQPAERPDNVIRPDFGKGPESGGDTGGGDPQTPPHGTGAGGTDEPDADTETDTPGDGSPEDTVGTGGEGEGEDRNRAPRNAGAVMLGDIGSGAALAFTLSHFLSRTHDADGDDMAIDAVHASSGLVLPKGDEWRYFADTDDLGPVVLTYTISDGEHAITQTAVLTVVENEFIGTDGDDLLVGTEGRDAIYALDGDDLIVGTGRRDRLHGDEGDDNIAGGDGDDQIHGGAGDDLIHGGGGNDLIFGGTGDDLIYGGDGDDSIDGGLGDDQLHGDSGNDKIEGDAGADLLTGDAGRDRLAGGAGHDALHGGDAADIVFGGAGSDLVHGEDGDDILQGGAGEDSLFGGAGEDVIAAGTGADHVDAGAGSDIVLVEDDDASDHYDGGTGEGTDVLNLAGVTEGVAVDLLEGVVTGLSIGTDSFENFEEIVGTTSDDHFKIGEGIAALDGNGGADIYDFQQDDTVTGPASVYSIADFGLDDRIWITHGDSHQTIRKAQRKLEDRLEDGLEGYADDIGADEPRLSFHHDWTEDYRLTVIEVDFDKDDQIDFEIILAGEHMLLVEHA